MKITCLIISLVFCMQSCNNSSQERTNDHNEILITEKLGTRLMSIWESGDSLQVDEIFHINSEYVDTPNHHIFKGRNGAKDYISHIHSWGSNIEMKIRNKEFSEDHGYIEWTLTATQSNPIIGRVPVATNKEITINGITLIETKDDLIIKATDYLDALGFVLQLGSKVELPGGIVIGI